MTCSGLTTDLTNRSPQEDESLSGGLEGKEASYHPKGNRSQYGHCRDNFKLRKSPNDKCSD